MKPKPERVAGRGRPATAATRPAVRRVAAAPKASSPDTMLAAAGLALVLLVLAETAFLALSSRLLAG